MTDTGSVPAWDGQQGPGRAHPSAAPQRQGRKLAVYLSQVLLQWETKGTWRTEGEPGCLCLFRLAPVSVLCAGAGTKGTLFREG